MRSDGISHVVFTEECWEIITNTISEPNFGKKNPAGINEGSRLILKEYRWKEFRRNPRSILWINFREELDEKFLKKPKISYIEESPREPFENKTQKKLLKITFEKHEDIMLIPLQDILGGSIGKNFRRPLKFREVHWKSHPGITINKEHQNCSRSSDKIPEKKNSCLTGINFG